MNVCFELRPRNNSLRCRRDLVALICIQFVVEMLLKYSNFVITFLQSICVGSWSSFDVLRKAGALRNLWAQNYIFPNSLIGKTLRSKIKGCAVTQL